MFQSLSFRELTSPMGDFRQALRSGFPLIGAVLLLLYFGPAGLHRVTNVIVRERLDNYLFSLQYEDGPYSEKVWTQWICDDYSPSDSWMLEKGFAPGLVLEEINFIDEGRCWSLNPDNQASWYNRKDEKGNYVKVSQ